MMGLSKVKLSILLCIIGLTLIVFLFSFFSAKTEASDKASLSDLNQIGSALNAFYQENGFYPYVTNSKPAGLENYLQFWPEAKNNCKYTYTQTEAGSDYEVTFCLNKSNKNYSSGPHKLTAEGIR